MRCLAKKAHPETWAACRASGIVWNPPSLNFVLHSCKVNPTLPEKMVKIGTGVIRRRVKETMVTERRLRKRPLIKRGR
jgi:hypothetical protein